MFGLYNLNQKYKGRSCVDYLKEEDLKRNNYIENFYRQHPCLSRDCAMAYTILLCNKDLTEEDKIIFTKKLENIRKAEEIKMKNLYTEFMKREPQEVSLETENNDMDEYIEKGKDTFGEIDLTENKIDA